MKITTFLCCFVLAAVLLSAVYYTSLEPKKELRTLDSLLDVQDSVQTVQHKKYMDKMQKVIEIQLLCIGKQQDFDTKMKVAEIKYGYSGANRHKKDFYRYRDSLIKYIKLKDSVEKTIK